MQKLASTFLTSTLVFAGLGLTGGSAQALTINPIESGDPTTILTSALIGADSGLTLVPGSVNFIGRVGAGSLAQSATYTDFNLVPNNPGLPTIELSDGIFLTSGVGALPLTNTDPSIDGVTGTGSDSDLAAILAEAGLNSFTNDRNVLEFQFTLDDPGVNNAVTAEFVFGSDEFPDQLVTDVFGFFIDGQNYAEFPDGSLVSFVQGANASNFVDNNVGTGNYNLEYDGISRRLRVTALVDPSLTTHTLKIAIADTSDTIFDSGVFISTLAATFADNGGVIPDPDPGSDPTTPEPATLFGLLSASVAFFSTKRRLNS